MTGKKRTKRISIQKKKNKQKVLQERVNKSHQEKLEIISRNKQTPIVNKKNFSVDNIKELSTYWQEINKEVAPTNTENLPGVLSEKFYEKTEVFLEEKSLPEDSPVKSWQDLTEENFTTYFYDVRKKQKPLPGMSLVRFRATAELINGDIKQSIVNSLLFNKSGYLVAPKLFQKSLGVTEKESIRLCLEILNDNISYEEILNKPYSFTLEILYWTYPELIPANDPHWQIIKLLKVS